jgi:hypothetical protein
MTGAKIVNHGNTGVRESFLQSQREIRADKACAASDDEVVRRVQF